MRTVVSKSDVAHFWANQTQEHAKSNGGGSLYFSGDTIYSYGSHFPIAKHVTNSKGETAVLFTTRTYSNTTAKHLYEVSRAVSHKNVIKCFRPDYTKRDNINEFAKAVESALRGLDRARKPEKYIQPAERILSDMEKYINFFGLNETDYNSAQEARNILYQATTGEYKQYLIDKAERIQKEKEEQDRKELAQSKRNIAKWRKFEGDGRLYGNVTGFDYLRYNAKDKRVETTQAVQIPEAIAKRAFNWIMNTIKSGGCAGNCEYSILDYKVSEVNAEKIKIGCHTITMKEVVKLATALNWV